MRACPLGGRCSVSCLLGFFYDFYSDFVYFSYLRLVSNEIYYVNKGREGGREVGRGGRRDEAKDEKI